MLPLTLLASALRRANALAFVGAFALATPAPGQDFDLVIRNGRVVDGTGAPWRRADVAVRGDTIVAVAPAGNTSRFASPLLMPPLEWISSVTAIVSIASLMIRVAAFSASKEAILNDAVFRNLRCPDIDVRRAGWDR